jgi:hypothetical protein
MDIATLFCRISDANLGDKLSFSCYWREQNHGQFKGLFVQKQRKKFSYISVIRHQQLYRAHSRRTAASVDCAADLVASAAVAPGVQAVPLLIASDKDVCFRRGSITLCSLSRNLNDSFGAADPSNAFKGCSNDRYKPRPRSGRVFITGRTLFFTFHKVLFHFCLFKNDPLRVSGGDRLTPICKCPAS